MTTSALTMMDLRNKLRAYFRIACIDFPLQRPHIHIGAGKRSLGRSVVFFHSANIFVPVVLPNRAVPLPDGMYLYIAQSAARSIAKRLTAWAAAAPRMLK